VVGCGGGQAAEEAQAQECLVTVLLCSLGPMGGRARSRRMRMGRRDYCTDRGRHRSVVETRF